MNSEKDCVVVVNYPMSGCYYVTNFGKEYHEDMYNPKYYTFERARYIARQLNKKFESEGSKARAEVHW